MHGRPIELLMALAVLGLASGCVQATRHSNTMYFGTNTTFGIKAGAATGQVPEVIVGYDRQEAVIMPLLANTSEANDPADRLSPCDVTESMVGAQGRYAVHPCSFVAFRGGSQDSYSVLASFGATFSADTNVAPSAEGGLAQYFATGMAAQILAAKGGAALVSTGEAAVESAKSDQDLSKLFPTNSDFAIARAREFDSSMAKLRYEIGRTAVADLPSKIEKFETALGSDIAFNFKAICTAVTPCVSEVNNRGAVLQAHPKFVEAVDAWSTY
jgi:hypothetical protein